VSTEGKVNLNYAIQPFSRIKRATALHGALQGVRITAIPTSTVTAGTAAHYKDASAVNGLQFRYAVNADATLEAFEEQRFDKGDVFRSPSEICEMWLVPKRLQSKGVNHDYSNGSINPAPPPGNDRKPSDYAKQKLGDYKEMLKWWEDDPNDPDDAFEATGDNLRESPYAQLYPRLATRSNVFTVHYRVQVLRKSRSTKSDEWIEGQDTVAAEQRGSTTLERYLDPNQTTPAIPDYANGAETRALDDFYKLRIVNRRVFAP
jgi:uncharacterized protein (TIGR02600 family)